MRLIIQETPEEVAGWTATYVAKRIKTFNPTSERPFVLGEEELVIWAPSCSEFYTHAITLTE